MPGGDRGGSVTDVHQIGGAARIGGIDVLEVQAHVVGHGDAEQHLWVEWPFFLRRLPGKGSEGRGHFRPALR